MYVIRLLRVLTTKSLQIQCTTWHHHALTDVRRPNPREVRRVLRRLWSDHAILITRCFVKFSTRSIPKQTRFLTRRTCCSINTLKSSLNRIVEKKIENIDGLKKKHVPSTCSLPENIPFKLLTLNKLDGVTKIIRFSLDAP